MLLRLSFVASAIALCAGCAPVSSSFPNSAGLDSAIGRAVAAKTCTVECWKPHAVTLKAGQTKYATVYLNNQTYYGGNSDNSCDESFVQATPAGDPTRQSGIWVWKWSITGRSKAKGPYHCKVSFGSSATGAVVTLRVNLKR